jgi:hypothetical protein
MEALLESEDGTRFIGTIERLMEGWRASFRLRRPADVFTEQGDAEFFSTELQAAKWIHTQANARGFSSIELRRCGRTSQAPRLWRPPIKNGPSATRNRSR